jgi:hypothetical protein
MCVCACMCASEKLIVHNMCTCDGDRVMACTHADDQNGSIRLISGNPTNKIHIVLGCLIIWLFSIILA